MQTFYPNSKDKNVVAHAQMKSWMSLLIFIAFILLLSVLPYEICSAATRYVIASGGAGTTCSSGSPCTLSTGLSQSSAGDTLYLKGGTYTSGIDSGSQTIPSGTAENNRFFVSSAPGETATIRYIDINNKSYITFSSLVIDTTGQSRNSVYIGVGTGYIRVEDCEIKNATVSLMNGIQTSDGEAIGFHEIVNNDIHNNGAEQLHDHGIYLGEGSPNVLIEGNHIHNNCVFGIQFNGATGGHTVRNNIIHDNNECGSSSTGGGFWIGGGSSGNKIYNNVIYNELQGMDLRTGSANEIYNNTFYLGSGSDVGILINSGQSNSILKNNIIFNPNGTSLSPGGSGTTYSNNLCRTSSTGCASTTSNVNFVNIGTSDFHLTTSSPAKDAGTDLSAQGFSTDLDGVSRPQGSAWDIGAYEFVQADTTDPVVTITAPTSNTTYSTATNPITTIAGTAIDAVGTTAITWANAATSGSGSGSGCSGQTSCNWSVSSISLNEGSNAITITGADAAANEGTDTITVTLDTTPPGRSNGAPSGTLDAGTTSTSISLTTNETATCKYGTSAGVAYGSLPNTFSSTNSTSHSTTVSSLSDGNSYTYYVRCQDVLNNANTSDFSISFSVDEEAVVTINPPSSLNTTHSSTVTVLSPPSTLNTTNTGSITVLGSPSGLNQTGGGTPVFLGQPLNLNNL